MTHGGYCSSTLDLNEPPEDENELIPGNKTPRVGQTFDNNDAAYEFYKDYVFCARFSIKNGLKKSKKLEGLVVWRRCSCSKQGSKDNRRLITVRKGGGEI